MSNVIVKKVNINTPFFLSGLKKHITDYANGCWKGQHNHALMADNLIASLLCKWKRSGCYRVMLKMYLKRLTSRTVEQENNGLGFQGKVEYIIQISFWWQWGKCTGFWIFIEYIMGAKLCATVHLLFSPMHLFSPLNCSRWGQSLELKIGTIVLEII